ncbi:tRNA uridine-5-carboxymethylaminomethyl(34) synthesis GTPase MnmE [Thermostilla marina]
MNPHDSQSPLRSHDDTQRECFVARLTPPGRGGVAVVSIEGRDAVRIVERLVVFPNRTAEQVPLLRPLTASVPLTDDGAAEQVVVVRFEPTRYEIHSHGGPQIVEAILGRCEALGAQRERWQDALARRSSGRIEAEAVASLADARTPSAAKILLAQYRGALRSELRAIHGALSEGRSGHALARVERLLARASVGLHLVRPWQVCIIGPPNAGKSTLINALVGYERAITDPRPGTTRDLVTAETTVGGWWIRLCDTAGLRETGDPLELAGTRLAERAAGEADLTLLVQDRSVPCNHALRNRFPDALFVWNKIDLPSHPENASIEGDCAVSAATGEGIERLVETIARRLIPDPPGTDAPVPFTPRQVDLLQTARRALSDSSEELLKSAISALEALLE